MRKAPVRIQLSRAEGFSLQKASRAANGLDVEKVDRTTQWGNPFVMGYRHTREECVRAFHELAVGRKVHMGWGDPETQRRYLRQIDNEIEELRGKNLACWCPPEEPCHVDVLLEILTRTAGKRKAKAA